MLYSQKVENQIKSFYSRSIVDQTLIFFGTRGVIL